MSDRTITDEKLNAAIQAGVANANAHAAAEPYPPINGDTWIGPWPDREWLIEGWLPVGRLGMLSGRGGRGKSRLALQLAARMAASPAARGPFVPAAHGPGNAAAVSDAHLALDATHTWPRSASSPLSASACGPRAKHSTRGCWWWIVWPGPTARMRTRARLCGFFVRPGIDGPRTRDAPSC